MLRITDVTGGSGGGSQDYKSARRTATSAALPAYTRTGNDIVANANGALPAISGVSLAVDDSFLHRNGAAGADNGLWDVVDLGSAGTPFRLTRSADADTDDEVSSGMQVSILDGTFAGRTFYLTTPDPIVLNTTALTFALEDLPASTPVAIGAYSSNVEVLGVSSTPGWNVLSEFDLDELPVNGAKIDGIALVSQASLSARFRLYDVTGAAAVAGSTTSTTSSLTGARLTTADLSANLVAGRRYQLQAECTGGNLSSDWAVVRYCTLVST